MKTTFTIALWSLSIMFFLGCNKNEHQVNEITDMQSPKKIHDLGIGKVHNLLLDEYQKEKDSRSGDELLLAEKIKLVDDYFIENSIYPVFSEYLDAAPEIYEFLGAIHDNEVDLNLYYELISAMFETGSSTEEEYILQLDLLDILAMEAEIDVKTEELYQMKTQFEDDPNMEMELKNKLFGVIDLSISSMKHWQDQSRGLTWYAKDIAGAAGSMSSGASNWGAAIAGPWGWVAVTLGVGAVSSML